MSRDNDTLFDQYRGDDGYESEANFYEGLGDDPAAQVVVTPGGTPSAAPWYETLIKTGLPVLATAYQQNQLTRLNIARVNAGLSPLTAEQYAAVYQPPSAQVTVGPNSSATKLIVWLGVGGAVLFGLNAFLRHRSAR